MPTLLESLLHGEFKFGFELEAYSNMKDFSFDNIKKEFKKYFGSNINIVEDTSLTSNPNGFEFPTPVMQFTPLNIKNCIYFLNEIHKEPTLVYTDSTCGFHVHFSFTNMNTQDMAWILCNIANSKTLTEEFTNFDTKYGKHFDFTNYYANPSILESIRKCIKTASYHKISQLLDNSKYRIIRLHPQGTLEWRGPRDFLNYNNIAYIQDFFLKLYKIITRIIEIMDKNEIEGISRSNFFNLINTSDIETYNISSGLIPKKVERIIENPLILTKLKSNDAYQLIPYLINELKENDTDLNSFLIPVWYHKFNNHTVVKQLLKVVPTFINYLDDFNLQHIVKDINDEEWYNYLNLRYISPEVISDGLKYSLTGETLEHEIEIRIEENKSIKSFYNKEVIDALKKYGKAKQFIYCVNKSLRINPSLRQYYIKFLELLS
jgi:hypothetical protein